MSTPDRLNIFQAEKLEREMVVADPGGQVMVDENLLTKEEIQSAMPAHLKVSVSDEFVGKINAIALDPEIGDSIRNNFISYTHVLKEGKFKVTQYMDAAAYVTYKMMGFNNQEAYARTFPDRMRRFRAEGKDDRQVSSFVSAYNKNKLVNLILEQTLIAPWVLNQDVYQQALFVQADLMENAQSEKVRCEAANSILNALKRPETSKISIDVDVKDTSGMSELKDMMTKLAENQQRTIEGGVSTKAIAHQEMFDDVEDAEEA